MGTQICDSADLCRLCGREEFCSVQLFTQDGQETDLAKDISFFLPITPRYEGPFPKVVCRVCREEVGLISAFFVRLNEGQARLADLLLSKDNITVRMPNWMSEKRSLFSAKYPHTARKPVIGSTPKPKSSELEAARIMTSSKRARKLPQRLAESVQGNDLEKMFKREEDDESLVVQALAKEEDVVVVEPKEDHSRRRRGRNRNRCDVCFKVFKLTGRLAHHRSTAHKGVYFLCTQQDCGKQYKTRDAIELHHKTVGHSDLKLFEPDSSSSVTCKECGKKFAGVNALEVHAKEAHASNKTFVCEECQKDFERDKDAFKDHMSKVHGEELRDYDCDECGLQFNNASSLYYHKESDHKNQMFECEICNRAFKNKPLLARHLAVVHTETRKYPCDLCDMKFKSSTNLKAHQTSHTGEKRFSCELCGKQFSYKTSLVQHIKWHEGDKAFKCPHCPKCFSQNGNLQEHIRIHTGEKPFACYQCERRFTTSSQHKLHEKRHRGEKPWKCEFCPKAFLHKDTWKSHIRRHKGVFPYSCEFCKKSFAEVWALKKHKRMHTGEKPYTCNVCKKTFSDCSNLTKHRRTHEKDLTSSDQTGGISMENEEGTTTLSQVAKGSAVWNIIREAAAASTQQTSNSEEDVQQIIYIAYDGDKDTAVHIVNQKDITDDSGATTVVQGTAGDDTLDLSHLSEAASLQLAEAVETTTEEEDEEASNQIHVTQDIGELHIINEDGMDVAMDAGMKEDTEAQYVDVKLKDGQIIRLKIPLNIDPIEYATEYLQTLSSNGTVVVEAPEEVTLEAQT